MNLEDLKAGGVACFLVALVTFLPAATSDEAPFLVPFVLVMGVGGFLLWLVAIVADATVRSLKKEK